MGGFSDFWYKSGIDFKGNWSPKLPTDAEIVMHIFLTIIDRGFDDTGIWIPFYLGCDEYPDSKFSDLIIIWETGRAFAPYYSIKC